MCNRPTSKLLNSHLKVAATDSQSPHHLNQNEKLQEKEVNSGRAQFGQCEELPAF